MKAILISLLVIVTTTAKALDHSSAPTYAGLKVEGITRNMTTVNPLFHDVVSANLTFNRKALTLTLNRKNNCPPNAMCIMSMPLPVIINLQVVKTETTGCSTKYTAVTPLNVFSEIQQQVIVEDYSFSACEMALKNVGNITYKVRGVSSLTKRQETATAIFSTTQFVRAQNTIQ